MTAKSSCGCGTPAPAAPNDEDVVWHDPTQYDPVRHGPPYLPARLGTRAKAAVRRVASSRVNPKAARRLLDSAAPLSGVLSVLRAASFLHQTHHWQTQGAMFYADHQLFDRLYNESQPFIDQVAERAVGLGSEVLVNPIRQAQKVFEIISVVSREDTGPNEMVQTSLRMESLVLTVIDEVLQTMRNTDALTNGTDNLLQGTADLHEAFVYLLQQRAGNFYDYGR